MQAEKSTYLETAFATIYGDLPVRPKGIIYVVIFIHFFHIHASLYGHLHQTTTSKIPRGTLPVMHSVIWTS